MKPTEIHDDGSDDHKPPAPSSSTTGEQPGTTEAPRDEEADRTEARCKSSMLSVARATETWAELGYGAYDSASLSFIIISMEMARDHLSALIDGLRARQSLLTQQGL
jgi:hypothetical protein